MDPIIIALIIIVCMLVLFVSEVIPITVTAVIACLAFALTGIIPLSDAFSGFGNDVVMLSAGMMVLGNALFETGVAQIIGKKLIAISGTNERMFNIVVMVACVAFGLVLPAGATVAMMLPITASVVAASGGKLEKKNIYMIVGMATVVGGGLTIVGSPSQLIAQNILVGSGNEQIGFFELSKLGLPQVILLFIYYQTIGFKLQKKVFSFPEVVDIAPASRSENQDTSEDKPKNIFKMIISVGVLVFCFIAFIIGLFTSGIIAMAGAAVCIVTGCISHKKVIEKMNWNTVILLGCTFGIATGFEHSGASKMIASGMVQVLGEKVSPWLFLSAFALVVIIFSNFMSGSAMASIFIPIAIATAVEMGFDVKSVVMIVITAIRACLATPISTPPITMTLVGGYRFKDYLKVGGLFNLMAYLLLVAMIPLFIG